MHVATECAWASSLNNSDIQTLGLLGLQENTVGLQNGGTVCTDRGASLRPRREASGRGVLVVDTSKTSLLSRAYQRRRGCNHAHWRPNTVHSELAGYLLENIWSALVHDTAAIAEMERELRRRSDPTWKINIRFAFHTKNRTFGLGKTMKEPDGALWSSVTRHLETVPEVAYANETRQPSNCILK